MPKVTWLLLCAALASGCAKTPEPVCMAPSHVDDGSCTTAILNIIASPESYEGRLVSVLGFVKVITDGSDEAVLFYPSRDAKAMQTTTTQFELWLGA